jgi:hypothetical protein
VRNVAVKIAEASGEVIDRTIRTFDQVRDPAAFIVDMESAIGAVGQGDAAMAQLLGMFGMGGMENAQMG